jgi:hypothetical protein
MTSTQIARLSSDQVGAIELTDIVGLTTTQVKALTTDGLDGITTSQILAMSKEQVLSLTTTQVQSLSSDQVAAFVTNTPLVLDLNGDGIQTIAATKGVVFDVDNDGKREKTGWVASTDGLLVRDLNGDGQINDGGELFGEGTVLADGRKAKDGYVALQALDSNLDGLIDANDAAFSQLSVWIDKNSDGKTDNGELAKLSQLGINSLSLDATKSAEINNGNLIGLMGSYTTADGATHTMGDVWFSVDATGKKVFDLAAVIEQGGSVAHVDLKLGDPATLNVSLQDVLAHGEQDSVSGLATVRIDGDAGDTVQLAQAGEGWSQTGTVTDGTQSYDVYVNQEAQLLVNHKVHTVII